MDNYQVKYSVFNAALQRVVYFMSKCFVLLQMYAASLFVLTFVLAMNTYVADTHNFYDYFVKSGERWERLIVTCVLYLIILLISYLILKVLCFLKNKECKENERI